MYLKGGDELGEHGIDGRRLEEEAVPVWAGVSWVKVLSW